MPLKVDVRDDIKAAQKEMGKFGKDVKTKATMRAINRSGTKARTIAVRSVSKAMGLKGKDVRSESKLSRASTRNLFARLTMSGRALPLIRFNATQTRKGAAAKAYGKRRVYPGTFIATDSAGRERVFTRTGSARLPIRQLYGPGIAKTFDTKEVRADVNAAVRSEFLKEFKRQVGMLGRRRR